MFGAQLKTWVGALVGRTNRPVRRSRSIGRRLAVEELEGRDVPAAVFVWNQNGPGTFDWDNSANWTRVFGTSVSGYPDAAEDVAILSNALTGNETIRLNTAITVGMLGFAPTGSTGTYSVVANGGSLTFDNGSNAAVLADTSNVSLSSDSINAPITLDDNLAVFSNGSSPFAIGGTITGTGVTATVTGTVKLTGAATVDSGVTLAGTGSIVPTETIFTTSYYDGALYQFDADDGALLATLIAPNGGDLVAPAGFTVGPDGNLYISSQGSVFGGTDSILAYDLTTHELDTFIDSAALNDVADDNGLADFVPSGLVFGPDGDLYVSMSGGNTLLPGGVVRFGVTTTGGVLSPDTSATTIASGITQATGLTFGTAANGDADTLYVSGADFNPLTFNVEGQVLAIDDATTTPASPTTFVSLGDGGYSFPASLTWGPDGKLYVVDLGGSSLAGQVLRYASNGSFDTVFVAPTGTGGLNGQFPSGAAFDGSGNLLTANLLIRR